MRISVAYNLRTAKADARAKLLTREEIEWICNAVRSLKHTVTPVEVSGNAEEVKARFLKSRPELIINLAPGTVNGSEDTFYPDLYEALGIPYTGGDAAFLKMNLDKNRSKALLAARGIRVPGGTVVRETAENLPGDLEYPVIIKPDRESSSKGISQDSVAESEEEAKTYISGLLKDFPGGLLVEEFIPGRELCVPFIEDFPGKILSIVEYAFENMEQAGVKYNIFDYDMKQEGKSAEVVRPVCPAGLNAIEKHAVNEMARNVFGILRCPDIGRVDIRLHENGKPYFIELNPIPSLHPKGSLMVAARYRNLELRDIMRFMIRSASERHGIREKR